MALFKAKRYEQLLTQLIADVVANSELSDVSDSSAVKHLLAACARQQDEIYYQMTLLRDLFDLDKCSGDDLDARAGEIQPGDMERTEATSAVGNLVFSRPGTTGTIAIPNDTRVKTADGTVFRTTTAGSITPTSPEQIAGHGVGRDSGLIPARAVEPSADGNVAAGTIVRFVNKPTGVNEVTNIAAFTGGTDEESDDAFRSRIKLYLASLPRSTVNALEAAVIGAQDEDTGSRINYAKTIEDATNPGIATVYIDDGTGNARATDNASGEIITAGLAPGDVAVGGEEQLYTDEKPLTDAAITMTSSTRGALTEGTEYTINKASGQILFSPALTAGEQITASYEYFTGLVALAQKIIDGDPTDRLNYPGYRAAGIYVRANTPTTRVQSASCVLSIQEGYDSATVISNVENAIETYVNGRGISDDVIRAALIRRIMAVAGVSNVSVTTPASDVPILDDEIARITQANILVV